MEHLMSPKNWHILYRRVLTRVESLISPNRSSHLSPPSPTWISANASGQLQPSAPDTRCRRVSSYPERWLWLKHSMKRPAAVDVDSS